MVEDITLSLKVRGQLVVVPGRIHDDNCDMRPSERNRRSCSCGALQAWIADVKDLGDDEA